MVQNIVSFRAAPLQLNLFEAEEVVEQSFKTLSLIILMTAAAV